MVCKTCGTTIFENEYYCPNCGTPVEDGEGREKIELTERHELVILTVDEIISGCHKVIDIDGEEVEVIIHPRFDASESVYIDGYGYIDKATGKRGKLKVDFLVERL